MVRVCCACGAQDKALKLVAEAQVPAAEGRKDVEMALAGLLKQDQAAQATNPKTSGCLFKVFLKKYSTMFFWTKLFMLQSLGNLL